jgi:6-phosphogluconolactonase
MEVVSDIEKLALRSVEIFVTDAEKAIKNSNTFRVAISGGHTPKRFFELLGELSQAKNLAWNKIHLFWVDERCVPIDSESSNYKLARDTFLGKVSVPKENIHRIPTECNDSKLAAEHYEKAIRDVFKLADGFPVFDLITLGMGVDGHTGSLFPGSYASIDTEHLVSVVYVLDEKLNRITLTHPVLKAAKHLVILITGEEKACVLREILNCDPDDVRYPIHSIWPVLDKVTWLIDQQAAKLL